ncbi:hypothetical protein, partial [Neisseria oralis]|uniref:hypothetical protein n=1 Tax=Neisseria oralis TaxID=1107316 RepID=UPI0027E4F885
KTLIRGFQTAFYFSAILRYCRTGLYNQFTLIFDTSLAISRHSRTGGNPECRIMTAVGKQRIGNEVFYSHINFQMASTDLGVC